MSREFEALPHGTPGAEHTSLPAGRSTVQSRQMSTSPTGHLGRLTFLLEQWVANTPLAQTERGRALLRSV